MTNINEKNELEIVVLTDKQQLLLLQLAQTVFRLLLKAVGFKQQTNVSMKISKLPSAFLHEPSYIDSPAEHSLPQGEIWVSQIDFDRPSQKFQFSSYLNKILFEQKILFKLKITALLNK